MNQDPEHHEPGHPVHHSLMEIFEEESFFRKIRRVLYGLGQPYDSGAARYARLQLLRLLAPLLAIVVPALALVAIMFLGRQTTRERPPVKVRIIQAKEIPELDEVEDEIIEEPLEPPEPIEMDFTPELAMQVESPVPQPDTTFTPQPAEISSVAIVKSPVIMKGIVGNRSPGMRAGALAEYGGNKETEGAVILALRWLKKNQNEDGSWQDKYQTAMTGFGLLTFLAHGETPASEEFGDTVKNAIRWLVEKYETDGFPVRYQHAIATYALCEAYALTRIPMIKDVIEPAVDKIIQGQNESGGWSYQLKPCERDDTSVMGWCAQALKAAHMAGLDNPGLDEAIAKAVEGFKGNAAPQGGFGYTGPGHGGLTGVGVLCMQLLGAGNDKEARLGLVYLDSIGCDFEQPWGARPFYYWYYTTQAKFHAGPEIWKKWNAVFAPELVEHQIVIEGGGVDGKNIGYWKSPSETEDYGSVYDTTLCALQLQVYYRYLPTFKTPQLIDHHERQAAPDEIKIEFDGLNI